MAHLSLSLLGPFQVTLDGQPVTGVKSNKVRALLAYLAVEADRTHHREVLAGLLWPDRPDRDALGNLRYALSNLRKVIGDRTAEPPFLLITRDTLQFNTSSDYWLDVAAFMEMAEEARTHQLEQAVALYRGSFLEGFSLGDSPAFEEWALFTRERIARQMSSMLHRLAATYEQRGEYERAQSHAWRQVELEPWDEVAHGRLMRTLALDGQRSAALAQYETCRRLLAEELGVEPAAETTALYEQIRDGELKAPAPFAARPLAPVTEHSPFLDEEPVQVERPVFVARERELVQLDRFLGLALAGQGRVAFVTGEAGSGKTALVQEFARRAQEMEAGVIVASGDCNAYTGIGDPYLPFCEILELLTGDVEARRAAGAMTREHARRLWDTLPLAAQALVEAGPDLIDTFVPGGALLQRAMACAPVGAGWLTRLDELVGRRPTGAGAPGPQQSDLFSQYTRVLKALARRAPLVLVVDDLQWADAGSINLLFHLGRQLAGSRILIVGAYRSEEVALGRDGARHPLEPLVNEFQRDLGEITVSLGLAGGQAFVDALLDSPANPLAPNRLGAAFREMLYRQTRGHPLFTLELLRGMQERGDLVRDAEGRWVEGSALDWETLPARVEAAIGERIGRLAQPLQAALRVASVEGEVFTAEVVARVRAADEGEVVARLSGELDRRHRLIRAQGILRIDGQRLSHYRFRHILFQRYLYNSLDEVERAYLHEAVGNTLEALYEGQIETVAAAGAPGAAPAAGVAAAAVAANALQLAWHFQEAGIAEKAIHYLHQAGARAVHLSAYQEGMAHLTRGLALLRALPDAGVGEQRSRAQQELALLTSLLVPLSYLGSVAAPEMGSALDRVWELSQQVGEASQLFSVMLWLSAQRGSRGELRAAREISEQVISLAERAEAPLLAAMAHHQLGWLLAWCGEFTLALDQAEQATDLYTPQERHGVITLYGLDAGVQCHSWASGVLWFLGYPDQALQRSQRGLALAREEDHAYSLAEAQSTGGVMVHLHRRDLKAAQALAEEAFAFASEREFRYFLAQATMQRGRVLAERGRTEEGIAQLRQGLAAWETTGSRYRRPTFLAWLAEAYGKAGQAEEGLNVLAEALAQVEETGERYYEAELHRLKGELLMMEAGGAEAEASLHQAESCFQRAIEVARGQRARSWELRATVSLCRLWQVQGRVAEAQQMLAEIYGWFTEGLDTPDLKEARALLEELSC